MKYQTLEDQNLSAERKAEFLNIVGLKIQAALTEVQITKLKANTEVYDRIKNREKSK